MQIPEPSEQTKAFTGLSKDITRLLESFRYQTASIAQTGSKIRLAVPSTFNVAYPAVQYLLAPFSLTLPSPHMDTNLYNMSCYVQLILSVKYVYPSFPLYII
jgi:hypothetical protein